MKKTLLTLALATMAAHAQAATWTLGDTSTSGSRFSVAALTDTVGSLGSANQFLSGNIGSYINETTIDSVTVGSWDASTVTLGGNSIDLGISHEANVSIAGNVAIANLITSVSLDNATIADTGLTLNYHGHAPSRLTQNFIIAPELGEAMGDLVNINMDIWATHSLDGNLIADSLTFEQDFYSSYDLYLNGSVMDAGSFDALGSVGVGEYWSFQAHIGDEIRLEMRSQSQITGTALGLGGTPELFGGSEAFASMTVTPVPEPESWAMLLMGLGLVGLRLRSKPKSFTQNKISA
ncbi:MAG: hypothetical protein B7Y41_09830 [Hydrogenophilales bacterium 28-61-23]|nr:MAG: hypothetical protein B7Y41_09830 [Hydrogenophilales bacterium 28-61-23]